MAAPLGSIFRGPALGPSDSSLHKSDTSPAPLLHICPHHLPVLLFSSNLCYLSASCFFFYQSSTSSPHHPKSPDKPTAAALYSPPSPPLPLLYSCWQRHVSPISRALVSLLSFLAGILFTSVPLITGRASLDLTDVAIIRGD